MHFVQPSTPPMFDVFRFLFNVNRWRQEQRGGQADAGQTDADFRDARLFVDEEVCYADDVHEATPNFSTAPQLRPKD